MARHSTKDVTKTAPTSVDDQLECLQGDLNKLFGDGTAARLDDPGNTSKVEHWCSTRSMVVDSVLRGGRPVGSSLIPFGRQVELSGLEGSGKTTLCAQIAAEVQSQGGVVIVTDSEERIDEPYWQQLGVDTHRIVHLTAQSIDDVFNKQYATLKIAKERMPDTKILLLWDSLGGTTNADLVDPKNTKETPMEQVKAAYGRIAAQISRGIILINSIVADTRACYLYTNHMYSKMNVQHGDPFETYGGQKAKYFATVRLRLTKGMAVREIDEVADKKTVGHYIRIKALKNSMAPNLLEREAVLLGGRGFVNAYTVFETGAKLGVISKSGSWTRWITPKGEEVKFQGFAGFEEKVVPHPEYKDLVEAVERSM